MLLGCANKPGKGERPWVWQAVTSSLFAPLATADALELLSLPNAVERILQRAESRDCRIVAWSEHELNVVRKGCPEHLDRFGARFVYALGVAKRWRNKCHDGNKPPLLRDHNRHDCAGMRKVCQLAAGEIAEHDRAATRDRGDRSRKTR